MTYGSVTFVPSMSTPDAARPKCELATTRTSPTCIASAPASRSSSTASSSRGGVTLAFGSKMVIRMPGPCALVVPARTLRASRRSCAALRAAAPLVLPLISSSRVAWRSRAFWSRRADSPVALSRMVTSSPWRNDPRPTTWFCRTWVATAKPRMMANNAAKALALVARGRAINPSRCQAELSLAAAGGSSGGSDGLMRGTGVGGWRPHWRRS